jgi:hypothetical protein
MIPSGATIVSTDFFDGSVLINFTMFSSPIVFALFMSPGVTRCTVLEADGG